MSNIFTEIKLDLFVKSHPRVNEFKRKAKELKKNKYKDLPLMTCQEIVAQLNGFNNWHHFLTMVKKSYEKELDNKEFIITKNPMLDYDHILMGHDINMNNYKWQDDSSMCTHCLIVGENLNQMYEMFVIKQLIEKNKCVYVCNQTIDETYEIINLAKKNKRENDLSIVDFSNNFNGNKFAIKIKDDFSSILNYELSAFLFNISSLDNHYNEYDKARILSLLSIVSLVLTHLRDSGKIKLNFFNIKDFLNLEKIKDLKQNNFLPKHIQFELNKYLSSLDSFDEKTGVSKKEDLENFHNIIKNNISKHLDIMASNDVFNADGVDIEDLFSENKKIIVFNFLNDNNLNKLFQYLILNIFKKYIAKSLSVSISQNSKIFNQKIDKKTKYVFFRDIYLPNGFLNILAQARSLKISLFFSYKTLLKMESQLGKEQTLSIIGNTNTKIFKDEDRNLFQNEFSQNFDSSFYCKKNLLETYNLEKNKDYFWILKNDQEYQLNSSFLKF